MELPNLDALSFPDDAPGRVVISAFGDEADLSFTARKDDPTGVEIVFTYRFPHNAGTLRTEMEFEPDEAERIYRLMRSAVAHAGREIVADKQADPELPPLKMLQDVEVPSVVFKPLVLESAGRRKVLDVRAGSVASTRHEYLDTYPASDDRSQWGYVTAVKVHRITCESSATVRKVGDNLKSMSSWRNEVWKSGVDGRPAWFEEFLPHVAKGNLCVEMCLSCKPLGEYSRWINTRIPSGSLSDADRKLIAESLSAQEIHPKAWVWMWRQWMAMTPQRWEALAELIAFLDHEVNGERGPAAGETDGDTVE